MTEYKRKYIVYKEKYLNLKDKCLSWQKDTADLLEKGTKSFISSLKGSTPIYDLSITDARKVLNDIQVDESYKNNIKIEEFNVNLSGDNKINFSIFRPKNTSEILPAIIYVHGGGWVLGNRQTHGRLMSELANKIPAAVIYLNYSPAPEEKHPSQLKQMYESMKYIVDNSSIYKLDTSKLVIMGDSVGGNMATVLTMLSIEKHTPKISYQILMYPVTDATLCSQSYQLYQDGPWLTKKSMEWFFNAYEPNIGKRINPTISPLNASPENIKGMPPTLIIVGENDVLRDEVESYAHLLMNNGIDVTAVRYLGTIHDFMMLDPLKNTPAVKSAIKLIVAHVRDVVYGNDRSNLSINK